MLVGNDFWFYNYFPKPVVKKEELKGWRCGIRDYYFDQNKLFRKKTKLPEA